MVDDSLSAFSYQEIPNPKSEVNNQTMEMKVKTVPRCVLCTFISIHVSEYSEVEYPMLNTM